MHHKAILLLSIGAPKEPSEAAVKQFLTDYFKPRHKHLLSQLKSRFDLNSTLLPQIEKITADFKSIWSNESWPIVENMQKQAIMLQDQMSEYTVKFACLYGEPSLEDVLTELTSLEITDLTIVPLMPQYTTFTTEAGKRIKEFYHGQSKPKMRFINDFHRQTSYINSFIEEIKIIVEQNDIDDIVFAYRQLPKNHFHANHYYYRACNATSVAIMQALDCDIDFQSTYQGLLDEDINHSSTYHILGDVAARGKRHVLVITPNFMSDCIATQIRIADQGQVNFLNHGGQSFHLLPPYNSDTRLLDVLTNIVDN